MEEVLNILYEFMFGNPHGVQMGWVNFLIAGISMIGGMVGSAKARSAARQRATDANDLQRQITGLENSRQNVINPYADVKDLSGMVTNPFQNLQVATGAAEMQAEEQDISLATTLDTLRATGASAGGATALAQAASRSKANIAASIEKQEAQNSRLRAQGEQRMQQLQMSEAARVQGATAQGKAFMFNAQERRDVSKLNRLAGLQQNAEGQANQLRGQASALQGQAWGALGSMAGDLAGNDAWNKYAASKTPKVNTNDILDYGQGALGGMPDWVSDLANQGKNPSSDRRLKENIKLIGYSPSGLKIYAFEYINKIFGKGRFQGVMSDEIPQIAIMKHKDGYDRVDYSKLDVTFKQI